MLRLILHNDGEKQSEARPAAPARRATKRANSMYRRAALLINGNRRYLLARASLPDDYSAAVRINRVASHSLRRAVSISTREIKRAAGASDTCLPLTSTPGWQVWHFIALQGHTPSSRAPMGALFFYTFWVCEAGDMQNHRIAAAAAILKMALLL